MKPYPAYKDSGVEWLGEVPEGWETHRFRHLFRESPEKIESEVVGQMLSVSGYRGIEIKDYDDENRRRTDDELSGYRIVRQGQLVVNTMWLNYAGLGVSAFEGHVSPAYRAYDFRTQMDRGYAHHLLRSSIYVQGYTRLLTGIRPNSLQMSREDLMDFPVLLPPLPEQQAIAGFLDRETAKIDGLIEEQRRLIALLAEKRQATISHAVTRGLNPDASLKPSGVDWLGDIPEGWEVVPLRRCTTGVQTGSTPAGNPPTSNDDAGFLWYTPGDFGEALDLGTSSRILSVEAVERGEARVFPAGSVLIVSIGATLGKVGVASRPCSANQQINAAMPSEEVLPRFLGYSLSVKSDVMRFLANASTIGIMNQEKTKEIVIVLPSLEEQATIVIHLDEQTAQLDALTETAASAITLLQERRAALISAAVTGKIDLRGLASVEAA